MQAFLWWQTLAKELGMFWAHVHHFESKAGLAQVANSGEGWGKRGKNISSLTPSTNVRLSSLPWNIFWVSHLYHFHHPRWWPDNIPIQSLPKWLFEEFLVLLNNFFGVSLRYQYSTVVSSDTKYFFSQNDRKQPYWIGLNGGLDFLIWS